MKIVVVYNKKSGGAFDVPRLKKIFNAAGYKQCVFIAIDAQLQKNLSPYVADDSLIAAVGGDGTISAVAQLVAGTDATLAPLPGGTLNHFTKDLGVDQTIETAVAHLATAHRRKIDIAKINDIYFINNSSIGLYPSSLKEREKLENQLGKWPSAVIGSLKALFRFRRFHVSVHGKSFRTPFIFVGNNRYEIDGVGPYKRTHLNKGVLTVFVARSSSRIRLLYVVLLTLIGKADQATQFDAFYVEDLTIRSSHKKFHISHDGEVSTFTPPIHYSLQAKHLWIQA